MNFDPSAIGTTTGTNIDGYYEYYLSFLINRIVLAKTGYMTGEFNIRTYEVKLLESSSKDNPGVIQQMFYSNVQYCQGYTMYGRFPVVKIEGDHLVVFFSKTIPNGQQCPKL